MPSQSSVCDPVHIRGSKSSVRTGRKTDEEVAFYDALSENESARQVMGEPTLRVIARELLTVMEGRRLDAI